MNLVFRVWIAGDLLSSKEGKGFDHWFDIIFFDWVAKNQKLSCDLKDIIARQDLYPSDFLEWFADLPGYKRVLKTAEVHSRR